MIANREVSIAALLNGELDRPKCRPCRFKGNARLAMFDLAKKEIGRAARHLGAGNVTATRESLSKALDYLDADDGIDDLEDDDDFEDFDGRDDKDD